MWSPRAGAEGWGGSVVDMKVMGESCLSVGRAVRELEVSGTPSELQLSLISLLHHCILRSGIWNSLSTAASRASQTFARTSEPIHCVRLPL